VPAVTDYLNERHGLEAEHVAAVGPAGENRVRFASVMTYDSRAFGRGGLGAALGEKTSNLLRLVAIPARRRRFPKTYSRRSISKRRHRMTSCAVRALPAAPNSSMTSSRFRRGISPRLRSRTRPTSAAMQSRRKIQEGFVFGVCLCLQAPDPR
jgi:aldehyde:ferredoxin oxidoreductase